MWTVSKLGLALPLAWATMGCGQLTETDLLGVWGGEHVSLRTDATGGEIEYDCAHGAISEPIRPDANGAFEVSGLHVFEHGGPVIQDEPPDEHPAIFRGTVKGRTMTYSLTVTDMGLPIGPFVVQLGEPARLFKCL